MAVPKVDQTVLDEALRIGNQSATLATRYMNMNRNLIDAIEQALILIKTGRITEARNRLDKALVSVLRTLS